MHVCACVCVGGGDLRSPRSLRIRYTVQRVMEEILQKRGQGVWHKSIAECPTHPNLLVSGWPVLCSDQSPAAGSTATKAQQPTGVESLQHIKCSECRNANFLGSSPEQDSAGVCCGEWVT